MMNPTNYRFLNNDKHKELHWKMKFPHASITFTPEGIILHRERYGETRKATTSELTELCTILFSQHFYKDKFNVFKAAFEDDFRTAIEKVLRFHSMRTSKKNHRKFSKKMRERSLADA